MAWRRRAIAFDVSDSRAVHRERLLIWDDWIVFPVEAAHPGHVPAHFTLSDERAFAPRGENPPTLKCVCEARRASADEGV
tara:strand:- start:2133 stop:2372 length:240 start_codon:yes stop_codon:yes gene_type:complete